MSRRYLRSKYDVFARLVACTDDIVRLEDLVCDLWFLEVNWGCDQIGLWEYSEFEPETRAKLHLKKSFPGTKMEPMKGMHFALHRLFSALDIDDSAGFVVEYLANIALFLQSVITNFDITKRLEKELCDGIVKVMRKHAERGATDVGKDALARFSHKVITRTRRLMRP